MQFGYESSFRPSHLPSESRSGSLLRAPPSSLRASLRASLRTSLRVPTLRVPLRISSNHTSRLPYAFLLGPPCVTRPGNGQNESAHTQTQENLKMKTNGRITWSQTQHRGAMRKERVSAITRWRKTPPSQARNTTTKHTHTNISNTTVQPSTCIHFNGTK